MSIESSTSTLPSLKGIRLLFVGTYPPPYGGIATLLKNLLPSLMRAGAEDIAVITRYNKNTVELIDGATIYRINFKSQVWRIFLPWNIRLIFTVYNAFKRRNLPLKFFIQEFNTAILINRIASKHKSEIVNFYHSNGSLSLVPLNNYWRGKRKLLLNVYGEVYGTSTSEFMREHRDLIEICLKSCNTVMASSEHCANSFKLLDINVPIKVVFVGVETEGVISEDIRKKVRNFHGIKITDVVVIFMARMIKDMGLDVVIDTAGELFNRSPDVHLIIAGATGDLTATALAMANNYTGRVTFLENVSFQEKRELYSAADILVAPSFNQRACMGVSMKEAMAASLPVIAGEGGGMSEAVLEGQTGFLIPLTSSGEVDGKKYVNAVCRLVEDPQLRRQLGQVGRQRAMQIFCVNTTNRRIAEIIKFA